MRTSSKDGYVSDISCYRFDIFFSGIFFTYHRRFEIEENGPGHVFSAARFAEEGLEAFVVCTSLRWQHTVWLYTVLQTIKLPAGVAYLHTALANVDRKYLALSILIN